MRLGTIDWNGRMDLRELEAIAESELLKHGLRDWSFGLAKTKRRQGVCKFRDRRIEIAEYYARHNPPEKVLDTLLHEIAHAIAGPKARHGPAWKAVAEKLGATPRAYDTCVETIVMPGDWQATCEACNKTYHKYKRPQRLTGYQCRCVARKPLSFQFVGDPAQRPPDPPSIEQAAKWEAKCGGCQTVHLRIRKPKAGVWRCGCPHRCELVWRFRASKDTN
ncbi:MAG TPA: SprT-like domain-containing protein [Planctomycetaceae bacterium]|nr:SprT-like domain-containing protein [Planctomycetaceae bacterium]